MSPKNILDHGDMLFYFQIRQGEALLDIMMTFQTNNTTVR